MKIILPDDFLIFQQMLQILDCRGSLELGVRVPILFCLYHCATLDIRLGGSLSLSFPK